MTCIDLFDIFLPCDSVRHSLHTEYFLFDLYDKQQTGVLSPSKISNMFSEIHCIDQNQSDVYMHR